MAGSHPAASALQRPAGNDAIWPSEPHPQDPESLVLRFARACSHTLDKQDKCHGQRRCRLDLAICGQAPRRAPGTPLWSSMYKWPIVMARDRVHETFLPSVGASETAPGKPLTCEKSCARMTIRLHVPSGEQHVRRETHRRWPSSCATYPRRRPPTRDAGGGGRGDEPRADTRPNNHRRSQRAIRAATQTMTPTWPGRVRKSSGGTMDFLRGCDC